MPLDRFDAMQAFVSAVEAGSLSAAARRLGRSPASISRAVALLEQRTRSELLRRTTRALKLTEDGARYLAACRRILAEIETAELAAAGEPAAVRGALAVTAPVAFGARHVRTIANAFLAAHPEARLHLLLLDRVVNLVEEGLDVAIRIAHLPDSSLLAVKVGEVRRVVCASPAYLKQRRPPRDPSELTSHDCISFSQLTPSDVWSFAGKSHKKPRQVKTHARLIVNSAEAAIGAAVEARGITCVLSYQVDAELRAGKLTRLLAGFEPAALPVHVVYPAASAGSAKVRAFVDLAVRALRGALAAVPEPARQRQR
jgi:DNA-binding transcriptional LysR family regulator